MWINNFWELVQAAVQEVVRRHGIFMSIVIFLCIIFCAMQLLAFIFGWLLSFPSKKPESNGDYDYWYWREGQKKNASEEKDA